MSQGGTSAGIGFLRERIAEIEGRDTAAHRDARARVNFGEGCSLDRVLDGGLSRGALHEIVPGRPGDATAASGFAAALAARFALEHFPANRSPVRVAKMRQNKDVELLSDSSGSESALDHDGFGSDRSISISMFRQIDVSISMFRKIDIDVMNVIDSKDGERDRQIRKPALKAGPARSIVWILEEGARREWGAPYGPGLRLHGLDPARLVLVHARDAKEGLWSLEEAVKCRALAAVVAEIWTLEKAYDLTASRRLVLAAQKSGTPALLVAPKLARGADRLSSGAETRFEIFSLRGVPTVPPSNLIRGRGPPLPGLASWSIRIVKARAGPGGIGFDRDRHLTVAWDHEKACFRDAFPLTLSALPRNRSGPPADARARLA
jgi:protein ImuA